MLDVTSYLYRSGASHIIDARWSELSDLAPDVRRQLIDDIETVASARSLVAIARNENSDAA